MAGTIGVDVVQTGSAGLPPVFKDSTGTEMGQLCRAWVNFNGVTTATVRASFNVSSVTRNGTGNYTVNFTTAMADANFCSTITTSRSVSGEPVGSAILAVTASSLQFIHVEGGTGSARDIDHCHISVFR